MNDLQELTAVLEDLNRAASFQDVARHLTRWARVFTGCQAAILRLLQDEGKGPWLAGCVVDGAATAFARDEMMIHGAECICGRVAAGAIDGSLPCYTEGGSFVWGSLSTLATDFAAAQLGPLRGRCIKEKYESLAVFPLRAGGRMVGSLHLADTRPDRFNTSFVVVEAACRLAGDTLLRHKARERDQALLETIETALLPAVPPAVDGLNVGVSFTSATEMAHVGGDFYDVLDLGDAGALVLVGDVSGKGVEAVGTAARARYAIEAQASLTPDPVSFMSVANDSLARLLPTERFVAAAACLIDRRSGAMTTCLAGHPSPLLLTASGVIEIDAPHNPPLGLFSGLQFAGATQDLPAEGVLLVYTDGVTDSRHGDGSFGREGIVRAVEELPDHDPERIARSVCAGATRFHDHSLPSDDRLVVPVRRDLG
jgi:serine phosphatase RsbU (regulator of sigma subunit)